MNQAARSVWVFGIYLLGLGAALLLVPALILMPFRLPVPQDIWIRVVGMLVLFLGTYYIVAARQNSADFLRWTVRLRASVIVFFAAFVALDLAPAPLLLFGAVDLAAAAWTWLAMRAQTQGIKVRLA